MKPMIFETAAMAGFLDLVELADHPGDRLAWRHVKLTPLAAAVDCADMTALAVAMARLFGECGLRGGFAELRARLPESVGWSDALERDYVLLLAKAEEFEAKRAPDAKLSDFRRFIERE